MAIFPTSPVPDTPYGVQDTFRTLASPEYDSGLVVFKSLRNYSLLSATLIYGQHTIWSDISGVNGLYDFFISMKGTAGAFTFIDFNGWDKSPVGIRWPKLYVNVGNGSATTFDVPMVHSSTYKLYVNGSDLAATEYIGGSNPSAGYWKLLSGTGTDGRDQVKFGTAPTGGQIIEWQATGQRVVKAHLTVDSISFNAFTNMIVSTGIGIREVR